MMCSARPRRAGRPAGSRSRVDLQAELEIGLQLGVHAEALGDALKSVSQTQSSASELQRKFQTGAEGVSLEETMIAMQKAQVGFQAALAVRNRLVSAYTDVMNMQV